MEMKRRVWWARGLTVAVLAIGLGVRLVRPRDTAEAEGPQGVVYSMLNAARSGDVKGYLACYTGAMEARLRQAGTSGRQLEESGADLKGVAVSEVQAGGSSAVVRVEYVYQDRNEAQTVYLEKVGAGWKIARVDGDERVRTLIPYGVKVR